MNSFINFTKLLAVVVLVTSCAYENDPGLQPKIADPKQQDSDTLKGKTASEKLKTKYKTLTAECTLSVAAPAAPASLDEAALTAAAVTAQPIFVAGEKVTLNFVAQVAEDKDLKAPMVATIVKDVTDASGLVARTTVKLTVAPLTFENQVNRKVDSFVYAMKHSPALTAKAEWEILITGSVPLRNEHPVSISEGILSGTHLLTTGTARQALSHDISCILTGEVDPEKEELKDQWLKVDCSKPIAEAKSPAEKALYKQGCSVASEERSTESK